MLQAMREIVLLHLHHRFKRQGEMGELRVTYASDLFPLLVESSVAVPRVYVLQPDCPGVVRMHVEELDEIKALRLPFFSRSGSQSSAVGPIVKRTFNKNKEPQYGPSKKTQQTTRKYFMKLSRSKEPWARFFSDVCGVLSAGTLRWKGKDYHVGTDHEDIDALAAAIRLIPDERTVFLTITDSKGRWAGEIPEYMAYLSEILSREKYVTQKALEKDGAICPLCLKKGVTIYPNALRGAGINFGNVDRQGSFPSLDIAVAWKAYGLCLDCADLLFIYKHHVSPEFTATAAGGKALLIPGLLGNAAGRQRFMQDFQAYVKAIRDHGKVLENDLMDFFADRDDAHVVLEILWATFGAHIDDVRDRVTDVLPSRLRRLQSLNSTINDCSLPLFGHAADQPGEFDLHLNVLDTLFTSPTRGKKRQGSSEASRRRLKLRVASCLYRRKPLADSESQFWTQILSVARQYLDEALNKGNANGLIYRHDGRKGDKSLHVPTLATWIRFVARAVYYLTLAEVLPMTSQPSRFAYVPEMEALKPYFTLESGLDSQEKAFTFILGVLFGKLLQVQSARGVNVSANALTWLKRLHLDGRDLPELYIKIREKLLVYGTEGSEVVRGVVRELGRLGNRLGNQIELDNVATCYFLLLGQSLSMDILPSKEKDV